MFVDVASSVLVVTKPATHTTKTFGYPKTPKGPQLALGLIISLVAHINHVK